MLMTHLENYGVLDRPEVLRVLFHPRKIVGISGKKDGFEEIRIPVEDDIHVGARFHVPHINAPTILFFHGNGEIAHDYDDIGPIFNKMNINFIVADYRGYGISDGNPSVSAMMNDCHRILSFIDKWKIVRGVTGALIVMGRSLGSAPALTLAATHENQIDGLIVESGFAWAGPLLELLGVNTESIGFKEGEGLSNVEKIRDFTKPTLIIHAEYDHVIPFDDGKALFNASRADKKVLLTIPGANHNDIFVRGFKIYMEAIGNLVDWCSSFKE